MNDNFFHLIPLEGDIPSILNDPFEVAPHRLCHISTKIISEYVCKHPALKSEADTGKMFGSLIVKTKDGEIGFLAAYSGQIDSIENTQERNFFVPAVFDYLQPDGYFKTHEQKISDINREIEELENDKEFISLNAKYNREEERYRKVVEEFKIKQQEAKKNRDKKRGSKDISQEENEAMIRESQFMKAELRRIRKQNEKSLDDIRILLQPTKDRIKFLKETRKKKSDDLQKWLFENFLIVNAQGEKKNLLEIFAEYGSIGTRNLPPSGSGECCAPKLLQYAFLHDMQPLQIAEFWWGESPKAEIRQHGNFYPACRGKCKPILDFMLKGVPLHHSKHQETFTIEVLYDDQYLSVINKPAGLLSVPGKTGDESVKDIYCKMYPEASGPIIVHRLDMSTSGLMILCKDAETYKLIQQQFSRREIHKRYVAVLDGIVEKDNGIINLPLCADEMDRPRQQVDFEKGKEAVTRYEVKERKDGKTFIHLFPLTGRTHQLRVHCAHQQGLGCPIVGDRLYGYPADRLMLHAEEITFVHPFSGKTIKIEKKAIFC